jgi:DNA-binding transcriptional regulator YbjK
MATTQTPQQERSHLRREALLQAAIELIAEGGLQCVTHRAVAARAGLPSSTVGYFFDSIDDLAAEALRAYMEREMADYRELGRAAGSVDRLVRLVGHRAVNVQLALAQVSSYLEAARNPAMREPAVQILDGFRTLAADLLRSIGHPHPEAVSPAMVALLDGFMLAQLADRDTPLDPAVLIDAVYSLLTGFLLNPSEQRRLVEQNLSSS